MRPPKLCLNEQIVCHWLKDVHAAGRITDDLLDALHQADVCIADVSGSSSNVMWETGYAMALGKPTILIGQCIREVPFDLRVHRVVEYSRAALEELNERLGKAIRETMARYEIKSKARSADYARSAAGFMVVTGTARADIANVERRLETVLQPYLGRSATWYCGSNGIVDECALRFLLARGEKAIAVGYNRYDLAGGVRKLVSTCGVPFLDAAVEPVPRGLAGPSRRDVFLCTKGDLIILMWDGRSPGTKRLIDYYSENGRNVLITFI